MIGKVSHVLRLISLGKYRTPLYFMGWDSYQSRCSGIITIVMAICVFAFALSTLIPIFERRIYEMQETAQTFKSYNLIKDDMWSNHTLDEGGEVEISLRSVLKMLFNGQSEFLIRHDYNESKTFCGRYNFLLVMSPPWNSTEKITLSFKNETI